MLITTTKIKKPNVMVSSIIQNKDQTRWIDESRYHYLKRK